MAFVKIVYFIMAGFADRTFDKLVGDYAKPIYFFRGKAEMQFNGALLSLLEQDRLLANFFTVLENNGLAV